MSTTLIAVIATHRPWHAHVADVLAESWGRWRARARQRRELLALQQLSPHTLRDVGLADLVPPRPRTLPWVDLERGRW